MSKDKSSKQKIGYKNPPVHSRFKPGQSGNPAGRPKGKTLTFSDAFEEELKKLIRVTEGGKVQMLTKRQAIVKQHTNRALNGDPKATALIMSALLSKESETADSLSPIIEALRSIHAKHEAAQRKADRARKNSGSAISPQSDQGNSDEA